nr:ABC-1 domain protein [uncultured bacterium]
MRLLDRPSRQNLARLEQVAGTFARHGLTTLVAHMRLAGDLPLRRRVRLKWLTLAGREPRADDWAFAVRDALVELGPAFIKAGQVLSVRADLVPVELADALRTLQDDVPPVNFLDIKRTVEAQLGQPLEARFRWFSSAPLAAASIAQVHAAELLDGTPVAVKVKRPGIDARVARDLDVIVWLAARLERTWPATRKYRPLAAAEEVRRYTLRELDFRGEARVMTRLGQSFADWPDVRIPRVYQATAGVLVMDHVACFPIDDLAALAAHEIEVPRLVQTAVDALLAQIYDFGLLHGDPHPGNLQVDTAGRLVFLDFGIYAELPPRLKRNMALSAMHLAEGDLHLATSYMLKVATLKHGADPRGFREAVRELYQTWRGSPAQGYGFGRLVYDQIMLAARYGVEFPADAIVFAKALLTLEGVAFRLAPDLDLSRQAEPFLRSLRWKYIAPRRWLAVLAETLPLWLDVAEELPLASDRLLERQLSRREAEPSPRPAWGEAVFPGLIALAGAVLLAGAVPPTWNGISLLGLAILLAGLFRGARAARPPRG